MKFTHLLPAILLCPLAAAIAGDSNAVVNMSHYDTVRPEFTTMARQGVVAAIHEATYPRLQVDAAYGQRQEEALKAGLYWGAYHFGDATNPVAQADHFMDVVENRWRQASAASSRHGVMLVLDFEENHHYPGGTMRVDQAVAFVERVRKKTGRYPGLYSNENRIKTILNSPSVDAKTKDVLRSCWLWIANYHRTPTATAPWPRWDLWQYTGDGVCELPRSLFPIAAANLRPAERNMFHGSTGELRTFWDSHAWQLGQPATAAASVSSTDASGKVSMASAPGN